VVTEADLRFFEVVKVSASSKFEAAREKTGYVNAMSYEEPGDPIEGYGVWIYDLDQWFSFDREELEPLGYKDEMAEAEAKHRPSLRVSPDGKIL